MRFSQTAVMTSCARLVSGNKDFLLRLYISVSFSTTVIFSFYLSLLLTSYKTYETVHNLLRNKNRRESRLKLYEVTAVHVVIYTKVL